MSPDTGKEGCLIIDLVDNTAAPGGILVAPDLWGLSHDDMPPMPRRAEEDSGAPDDSARNSDTDAEPASEEGRIRSVTFVERDDPFRLHKPTYKPLELMSKNAWVSCPSSHRRAPS